MPTGGGGDHGSPLPTNSSRAYLFRWRAEEGRDEPRRDQRGGRGVLLGGRGRGGRGQATAAEKKTDFELWNGRRSERARQGQ